MQQLPNNCRAGKMSVYPKNWNTAKANVKLTWYIKYRFYDDNLKKSKQVSIKGINLLTRLIEKQTAVRAILKDELAALESGYNPIIGLLPSAQETEETPDPEVNIEEIDDVTENTPFVEALYYSAPLIKCVPTTRVDIYSCLKFIRIGAMLLGYDRMPLKEVRRKHILKIFEKCKEVKLAIRKGLLEHNKGKAVKENWTPNTFNQYRSHLSMVYKQLAKMDAIEANIIEGIDKEKNTVIIRETLNLNQRQTINNYLLAYDYKFWRFIHIFFHSGCRIIEIMQVSKKDVDLDSQRFKVVVKKGQAYREEWRVIKTEVLPLWEEVCSQATYDQILFSEDLQPGERAIRREQVTRRWRRHVKKRFGITADFYSLKHTNTTEVMDLLAERTKMISMAEEAAAKMNGHTNTAMVRSIYDTKNKIRRSELIKEVKNKFA